MPIVYIFICTFLTYLLTLFVQCDLVVLSIMPSHPYVHWEMTKYQPVELILRNWTRIRFKHGNNTKTDKF